MFFEEKLEEIRTAINQISINENVLVWGTGRHTDELLKYTRLSLYHNLMYISMDNINDIYFGRPVVSKREVDWRKIDYIIISSYKFQNEIEYEIKNSGFDKKIIKFYEEKEEGEFYRLPHRDYNHGWYIQGNYRTWEEAKENSEGYDNPNILEKVYHSTVEVINGTASYERDSVLFYEPAYTYHLLTLIGILCSYKEVINVVDVGGALGSLYWQNKVILDEYKDKKILWKIVEQPNYVQCGREKIQNKQISFYEQLEDVGNADIIIFSSVLQYVENYGEIIREAINLKPKYILVDRTFFSNNSRIVVEYVGENICKGSYPARIFKEQELSDLMSGYRLKVKFPPFVGNDFYLEGMIYEEE